VFAMRLLVLALAAAAGPSAGAQPVAIPGEPAPALPRAGSTLPLAPICDERMRVIPADTPPAPEARRLGELPPGDTILAVYRESEDGCVRPVIVRYGDGRPAPAVPQASDGRPKPLR